MARSKAQLHFEAYRAVELSSPIEPGWRRVATFPDVPDRVEARLDMQSERSPDPNRASSAKLLGCRTRLALRAYPACRHARAALPIASVATRLCSGDVVAGHHLKAASSRGNHIIHEARQHADGAISCLDPCHPGGFE
jgi:hypothetical protein